MLADNRDVLLAVVHDFLEQSGLQSTAKSLLAEAGNSPADLLAPELARVLVKSLEEPETTSSLLEQLLHGSHSSSATARDAVAAKSDAAQSSTAQGGKAADNPLFDMTAAPSPPRPDTAPIAAYMGAEVSSDFAEDIKIHTDAEDSAELLHSRQHSSTNEALATVGNATRLGSGFRQPCTDIEDAEREVCGSSIRCAEKLPLYA